MAMPLILAPPAGLGLRPFASVPQQRGIWWPGHDDRQIKGASLRAPWGRKKNGIVPEEICRQHGRQLPSQLHLQTNDLEAREGVHFPSKRTSGDDLPEIILRQGGLRRQPGILVSEWCAGRRKSQTAVGTGSADVGGYPD